MNITDLIRQLPHRFHVADFHGGDVVFQWYPQRDSESSGHYVITGHDAQPSGTVSGFLVASGSRQDVQDIERYRQQERVLRRDILLSTPDPGIGDGDLLVDPDGKRHLVTNIVDESGEGFAIRLVVEDRANG